MATILSACGLSPLFRRRESSSFVEDTSALPRLSVVAATSALPRLSVSVAASCGISAVDDDERVAKNMQDYVEAARDLISSDDGPPRWFSPLESKARCHNAPLLLFLPGIEGIGLGLLRQHHKLGKMFDIWCLHIPASDRTGFRDLVRMVERTAKAENSRAPDRPIYLVGESLGACIALAVAASIPEVDLVLILANPATSFGNSPLQKLTSLAKLSLDHFSLALPLMFSSIPGGHLERMVGHWARGLPVNETAGNIYQDLVTTSTFTSILAETLEGERLTWKLQLLHEAALFANQHLHLVQAQTLILSSGNDHILPSKNEGKRLRKLMSKCEIRSFEKNGHWLFLEDGIDLVYIIKATSFYRRRAHQDFISDYIPPTISEFRKCYGFNRLFEVVTGSVFLSTREDGEVVRGLGGIPPEGPVLLVGNHMLLASDTVSIPGQFLLERNIPLRSLVHPLLFTRLRDGYIPDVSTFDSFRVLGSVPISGANLHSLLSSKCHVLMIPGGAREALHRKGEEYKLMWPEKPEFIRMAAKFGAKIVPYAAVGEDDVLKVVLDYNEQVKIPLVKSMIKNVTGEAEELRGSTEGEEGNQDLHVPGVVPKWPGRFYYYFGKPIETKGREEVVTEREKAREMYVEVKAEVERCIAFLKDRRDSDPYRPLLPRLGHHLSHGLHSLVPTFPFC